MSTQGSRSLSVSPLMAVFFPKNWSDSMIDNTNADLETRKVWIDFARKANISVYCVHFTAPAKLCEHNDTFRALNTGVINPEKRSILPHSAFTSFASRYREPQVTEGFVNIVPVDFKVRVPLRTPCSIV